MKQQQQHQIFFAIEKTMKQFFILKKYITKKGKGGIRRSGQRKGKGEEEKKKKKKWERWGMGGCQGENNKRGKGVKKLL